MKEGELQMIADHLGHSKQIHTTVYRLQENLIERSKMARILLASEQGTLSTIRKDTQLSAISIQDIPITGEQIFTKFEFLCGNNVINFKKRIYIYPVIYSNKTHSRITCFICYDENTKG